MGQIALPLRAGPGTDGTRIVTGSANRAAAEALAKNEENA